ncbi:MAG TPA: phytanoyl-CoA dioxygenase family protein [Candidatus Angelobacter sp.]|nr:phytanoyl-CoA dioxygenase family protein [Candidatus Angelobacter sp.]
MSAPLTDQQDWQEAIEEQGFAIVPSVLSTRELIPILVSLADLEPPRGRAGIRHVLNHPTVKVVAQNPRLLEMAQAVLGDAAFPFRATLFDKTPETNWLISWHQDTALPLQEKIETSGWGPWSVKENVIYAHAPAAVLENVLALRLHLDDVTEDGGPLRILPGTHGLGIIKPEEIERHSTYEQPVECIGARGAVVAMRPLVIHASSKSRSQAPRRVLHIEYAASGNLENGLRLALA